MNIVILGAGGFIGSHLVEHLLHAGEHEIVGLDLTAEKLGDDRERIRFYEADIRRSSALTEELIRRADVAIDLIAYANPSMYVTSPLEVFDLNFTQNLDIANLCIKHRTRLIQFSSAEVYGKASGVPAYAEDETDFVFGPVHKQRWIYASAKALLERVLFAHGVAGDLDYTIIRPFNFVGSRLDYLVGPGETGGPRVFPHFMSALLTGGPLRLVDGGFVHRAFLHVADGNTAIQKILDLPDLTRNQIYNVGNPANDITIRELAVLMMELYAELVGCPSESVLENITGEEFYGEGYEDSDRLPPDISKMRALGWAPRHDLRRTLTDAMAYYVECYGGTRSPLMTLRRAV